MWMEDSRETTRAEGKCFWSREGAVREAGEGRARNGTRCEDTPRGGAEGPGGGLQWKQRETAPGEAKAVTEGLWDRVTSLGSRAEWEGSSPSVSPRESWSSEKGRRRRRLAHFVVSGHGVAQPPDTRWGMRVGGLIQWREGWTQPQEKSRWVDGKSARKKGERQQVWFKKNRSGLPGRWSTETAKGTLGRAADKGGSSERVGATLGLPAPG